MQKKARFFIVAGALNAAIAVILGAFAAHGLKNQLTEYSLNVFHTAVDYHFNHALGLLLIGILIHTGITAKAGKISGILMLVGIVIFSGSLYLLAVTGLKWLGAITPIGGIAFVLAWMTLAVSVMRGRTENTH